MEPHPSRQSSESFDSRRPSVASGPASGSSAPTDGSDDLPLFRQLATSGTSRPVRSSGGAGGGGPSSSSSQPKSSPLAPALHPGLHPGHHPVPTANGSAAVAIGSPLGPLGGGGSDGRSRRSSETSGRGTSSHLAAPSHTALDPPSVTETAAGEHLSPSMTTGVSSPSTATVATTHGSAADRKSSSTVSGMLSTFSAGAGGSVTSMGCASTTSVSPTARGRSAASASNIVSGSSVSGGQKSSSSGGSSSAHAATHSAKDGPRYSDALLPVIPEQYTAGSFGNFTAPGSSLASPPRTSILVAGASGMASTTFTAPNDSATYEPTMMHDTLPMDMWDRRRSSAPAGGKRSRLPSGVTPVRDTQRPSSHEPPEALQALAAEGRGGPYGGCNPLTESHRDTSVGGSAPANTTGPDAPAPELIVTTVSAELCSSTAASGLPAPSSSASPDVVSPRRPLPAYTAEEATALATFAFGGDGAAAVGDGPLGPDEPGGFAPFAGASDGAKSSFSAGSSPSAQMQQSTGERHGETHDEQPHEDATASAAPLLGASTLGTDLVAYLADHRSSVLTVDSRKGSLPAPPLPTIPPLAPGLNLPQPRDPSGTSPVTSVDRPNASISADSLAYASPMYAVNEPGQLPMFHILPTAPNGATSPTGQRHLPRQRSAHRPSADMYSWVRETSATALPPPPPTHLVLPAATVAGFVRQVAEQVTAFQQRHQGPHGAVRADNIFVTRGPDGRLVAALGERGFGVYPLASRTATAYAAPEVIDGHFCRCGCEYRPVEEDPTQRMTGGAPSPSINDPDDNDDNHRHGDDGPAPLWTLHRCDRHAGAPLGHLLAIDTWALGCLAMQLWTGRWPWAHHVAPVGGPTTAAATATRAVSPETPALSATPAAAAISAFMQGQRDMRATLLEVLGGPGPGLALTGLLRPAALRHRKGRYILLPLNSEHPTYNEVNTLTLLLCNPGGLLRAPTACPENPEYAAYAPAGIPVVPGLELLAAGPASDDREPSTASTDRDPPTSSHENFSVFSGSTSGGGSTPQIRSVTSGVVSSAAVHGHGPSTAQGPAPPERGADGQVITFCLDTDGSVRSLSSRSNASSGFARRLRSAHRAASSGAYVPGDLAPPLGTAALPVRHAWGGTEALQQSQSQSQSQPVSQHGPSSTPARSPGPQEIPMSIGSSSQRNSSGTTQTSSSHHHHHHHHTHHHHTDRALLTSSSSDRHGIGGSGDAFQLFVRACCQREAASRPAVRELLNHSFLRSRRFHPSPL